MAKGHKKNHLLIRLCKKQFMTVSYLVVKIEMNVSKNQLTQTFNPRIQVSVKGLLNRGSLQQLLAVD